MGAPLLPHTPGIVIPALCRDPEVQAPVSGRQTGSRNRTGMTGRNNERLPTPTVSPTPTNNPNWKSAPVRAILHP